MQSVTRAKQSRKAWNEIRNLVVIKIFKINRTYCKIIHEDSLYSICKG
ncbi:hypothetical protein T458_10075 [Brevibacillus panacihumi W25]|uniref:Transposase n=1 Tax=Brevibacillus panacihumi W25 TaxID=1408254 RepID=V6M942_9BACL|nr:hypothetical protein T458_10075 [Brevibacillus panacihumi W25]